MDIVVVMPTRGRPEKAAEAVASFTATATDAHLVLVLDENDKRVDDYDAIGAETIRCRGNMIKRTNIAAMSLIDRFDLIGWMADDNRMRTPGWDDRVRDTFARPSVGFANLNDLFWSEMFPSDKPVNVFTRTSIVRALGWYANPAVEHHYMDDTWRLLGVSTDSMVYLRDVICEHLHPALNKGEWDQSYIDTESKTQLASDQWQFQQWIWRSFREDRERVKACLGS